MSMSHKSESTKEHKLPNNQHHYGGEAANLSGGVDDESLVNTFAVAAIKGFCLTH